MKKQFNRMKQLANQTVGRQVHSVQNQLFTPCFSFFPPVNSLSLSQSSSAYFAHANISLFPFTFPHLKSSGSQWVQHEKQKGCTDLGKVQVPHVQNAKLDLYALFCSLNSFFTIQQAVFRQFSFTFSDLKSVRIFWVQHKCMNDVKVEKHLHQLCLMCKYSMQPSCLNSLSVMQQATFHFFH